MKTRILAGLALVPLLLLVIFGGLPLYIGEFIIISIAQQMSLNLSKTSLFLLISICPVFAFAIMITVEGSKKIFQKIKFLRLIKAD